MRYLTLSFLLLSLTVIGCDTETGLPTESSEGGAVVVEEAIEETAAPDEPNATEETTPKATDAGSADE